MTRLSRAASLASLSLLIASGAACNSGESLSSSTTSASSATTGAGGAGTSATTSDTSSSSSVGGDGGDGGNGGNGGNGGDGGAGLDIGVPSNVYPAKHGAPPKVVNYGGPLFASPQFVPVFFANDTPAMKDAIKDFLSKLGTSAYWAATTQEYGVGPAVTTASIELAEEAAATIDGNAIKAWLAAKLNADDPAFTPVPAGAVYTLHYPAGTVITRNGQKSCQSFGGYHTNITLDAAHGNAEVAFAVIPRCESFYGLSGVDAVTAAASHELIESATDPFPATHPAFYALDNAHIYWMRYLGGGEVSDLCAPFPGAFYKPLDLGFTVQRSWSNKVALAGGDPCIPDAQGVYFNAVPVMKDTVKTTIYGVVIPSKGVKIPVGETRVVDVQLFSDADTGGPFAVDVDDISKLFGGDKHLTITLDVSAGENGQTLHASITNDSVGPDGTAAFVVTSTLGGKQNFWFGIVGK